MSSSSDTPGPGYIAALRQLADLAKKLGTAKDLPLTAKEVLLKNCLERLQKFDPKAVVESLQKELVAIRKEISDALATKREQVLQRAEQLGLAVRRLAEYDRIGPVRVVHKGSTTNILFGKLKLESFEEPSGLKAADRIASRVKSILADPFDPVAFYRNFRRAYDHARIETHSADGYVRVDSLHQEFALGTLRVAGGKRPQQTKQTELYPLQAFLVDFARFLRSPQYPEGEYIRARTPPMSQIERACLIPDLSTPLGDEKPFLDLLIERES